VSLNAIDETLPALLDRISRQVNMRYRVEGRTIVVSPDTPYLRPTRSTTSTCADPTSTIAVSGQITAGGAGGAQAPGGGTSSTSVNSN
jgi:general secretion pathway protein D